MPQWLAERPVRLSPVLLQWALESASERRVVPDVVVEQLRSWRP